MRLTRMVIWLGMTMAIAACGNAGSDENATTGREAAAEPPAIEVVEIVPGLSRRILREGTGATAEVGHTAVVHYTGWLYDQAAENNRGDKFDSSVDRGRHFKFPLGARRVIRGWDEGVVGPCCV